MHPRAPGCDPVARRALLQRSPEVHGRAKRKWVFVLSNSLSRRGETYPLVSLAYILSSCARHRIQKANAPDPWHSITSRTRTLTAIGDLTFRDPYYLNAGALFAGWYRGDRNIPRHNEPARGRSRLPLTNPGDEIPSD